MTTHEARLLAREVAMSYLGLPYLWGGDNPMEGFDCSGLVIEVLKSVGVLPRRGDWRARDLRDRFGAYNSQPRLGALVFWNDPPTHVEFCLNGKVSIGASGGGSATDDRPAAIRDDAYIKIRPFHTRGGISSVVDPFAVLEG